MANPPPAMAGGGFLLHMHGVNGKDLRKCIALQRIFEPYAGSMTTAVPEAETIIMLFPEPRIS